MSLNPFQSIRLAIESFSAIPAAEPIHRVTAPPSLRALAGGRISLDKADDQFSAWRTILPPQDAHDQWRLHDLDAKTLDRMSPAKLMELLSDLSPDISRALWDFLRMCNPGWEARALRPGSDKQDARAQEALDTFLNTLDDIHGALDVVFGRLFIGAFLRGAFFAELVLDKGGRMPVDLATPDPSSARFRRADDPERGKVWQLVQMQGATVVDLDRPTVRYVPVDPMPGQPYGRAVGSAALFTAVFGLAMLHDIRRVVQQQGWPRIDLEIDLERLLQLMPEDDRDNAEEKNKWITQAVTDIQTFYAKLEPDDAYVHPNVTKVNRPVGAVDSSSLGAVDGLIKALERMAVRALKTVPLMMGLDMSTSEGQANRQWEIYAAGIKALQHLAETLLERLLTLSLQAQGIVATVEFRFAELRVAELLRDAQVANLNAQVAAFQYAQGWISQDVAAQNGAGVAKADAPAPRTSGTDVPSNAVGGQPDPGSERHLSNVQLVPAMHQTHGATNGHHD